MTTNTKTANKNYRVGVKFTVDGSNGYVILEDNLTYCEACTVARNYSQNRENFSDTFHVEDKRDGSSVETF